MTQNDPLNHGQIAHEGFFDAIQEMLGAHVGGFRLERVNTTTIKVAAGTENGQVSIAVQGRYRWRTSETTAVLPGGLPNGEHPVFVTASDNDYTGPIGDPDAPTVYTFGLEIKESGKTPATALYREVGKVTVASGAITAVRQTVGSVSGAQIENGALSNEGDITWAREANGAWVPQLKAGTIATADMADGAVTSPKFKPTSGLLTASEGQPALSETFAEIPGLKLEITPTVASKILLAGFFERITGKAQVLVRVTLDGVQSGVSPNVIPPTTEENAQCGSWAWFINLTAAPHTLIVQARRSTNTAKLNNGITQCFYEMWAS
jgi:hypothetical protein